MESSLKQSEIDFLSEIPGIQMDLVGPMIGLGGAQHVVRAYGEDDVAKYPWLGSVRNLWSFYAAPLVTPTYDEIRSDYDICDRHFSEYLVVTDIRKHAKNSAYLLLQQRLMMRDFDRHAYADPALREQLQEILRINAEVRHRYGKWLDIMGFKCDFLFTAPYLANTPVLTDEHGDESIGIHDFSMMRAPSIRSLRGILGAVQLAVQRWQLKRFDEEWTM